MQFNDFVHRIQELARLATPDEAIEISRAVLETLGERLDRKVRNGVAAQLPGELKEFLLARAENADLVARENADRYNLEEFYDRVGARADLKFSDATERTGQVFSVLREAIPEGEVLDILESLPGEFGILFGRKPDERKTEWLNRK